VLLGRNVCVGGGVTQWMEATALWEGPDAHAEYLRRCRQDACDVARAAHCDIIRPSYWRMDQKPTKRINERTFLYGDPEGDFEVRRFDPETELYQVIDQRDSTAPETLDDLERLVQESEKALDTYGPRPEDFSDAFEAQTRLGPDYAVRLDAGYGLCIPNREPLWMEAVAARPDLVSRLLECQCRSSMRAIEALKDSPFRYLFGGGDFCCKHGPMYSPAAFRAMLAPRLRRMSALAHRYGKYTAFASDGNLWPVADDLFGATGTDAFYEIDRLAGMDLRKLRERFPHLTLIGNISVITLHRGTREQVIAQCRDCAETALELGSIIVGASNLIVPGTPPENIIAMVETLEKYH
jgi:hypothetical protein